MEIWTIIFSLLKIEFSLFCESLVDIFFLVSYNFKGFQICVHHKIVISSKRFSSFRQEYSLYSHYISSTTLPNIFSFTYQIERSWNTSFGYLIPGFLYYYFLITSKKTGAHIKGELSFQIVSFAYIWLAFLNWYKIFIRNCLIILTSTRLASITSHLNHRLDLKYSDNNSFDLD